MMGHRRPGAPLLSLVLLLSSWMFLRAAVWFTPSDFLALQAAVPKPDTSEVMSKIAAVDSENLERLQKLDDGVHVVKGGSNGLATVAALRVPAPTVTSTSKLISSRIRRTISQVRPSDEDITPWLDRLHPQVRSGEGQAMGAGPVRSSLSSGHSRWSGDSWMLVRGNGSRGSGSALALPSYGASQAGAVLRYRLSPDSPMQPVAYLRATKALRGPRQDEAAVGVSARPIGALPVRVAAEMRLQKDSYRTQVRPVVSAVTELPWIEAPHGFRLEAYGQAGYAGGKQATAFVDGQARLDRELANVADVPIRLGAGVWGGAQKGASRLDVGPTASIAVPVSDKVFARVSLDWRIRVAGNAAPDSGPAVTLSAGF